MRELKDARWIRLKAVLFVCTGAFAVGLLVADRTTLKEMFLLAVAIWAFCRAYYFAFYVVERYVDPEFRFSGLASLLRHLVGSRR